MYKDVARISREKIRKVKAQQEVHIITRLCVTLSYKIHQNCFYKHIQSKRRTKDNLHSSLDVVGNLTSEGEMDILSAFFTSVFNSHISFLQDTLPPELEDQHGKQNKPSIIQKETATCCFFWTATSP